MLGLPAKLAQLRGHSALVFGRLAALEWDAARNEWSVDARIHADVFVFAVQTQRDPATYDVIDISHWEFWWPARAKPPFWRRIRAPEHSGHVAPN